MRQRNVAPGSPANEKLAEVDAVGPSGPAVIVGALGGVRSIVHENVVGVPAAPSRTVRTRKAWAPDASVP